METHTLGFTLIEIMIGVSLFFAISAFGVVYSAQALPQSSVTTERDRLVASVLSLARSDALTNKYQLPVGVHIDNTSKHYILFLGNTYIASTPSNRTIPFSSTQLSITSSGSTTIMFAPLSGDVTHGTGTITVTSGVHTQTVTVNDVGMIDW